MRSWVSGMNWIKPGLRSLALAAGGAALTVPRQAIAQSLQAAGDLQLWIAGLTGAFVVVLYWAALRWLRRIASSRETAKEATREPARVSFSDDELERYARHIVLREIGGAGQQKLRNSKVLVVGAGGLGSPAILYLAAAGIGTIAVVDDDSVSISNLQRQIIHDSDSLGTSKVESARDAVSRLNPHVQVIPISQRLTAESAELLNGYDVVLDGSDNLATRRLVNRQCVENGTPLIFGAISQWEGQISVFGLEDAPCYNCVFPNDPAEGAAPSCAEGGVVGALPGVVGAMMASEAIKLISGAGHPLASRMHIHDALWGESRTIAVRRNPACAVCGSERGAGIRTSQAGPDPADDGRLQRS